MQKNMLDSLRSIVQEVNTADHLQSVLDITVARVQDAMGTEVCSVYLRESTSARYVFSATEGLNKEFVGKISMAPNEGLVGQVAARGEPLNLDNAEAHPKFLFMPGIGEERFKSFLGVPIIHQRKVLGVLVIQQQTRRRFDEDDEAFLVTISAQLAGVIAHAQATGMLVALDDQGERQGSAKFRGVAGAPGIAIGHAVVVAPTADLNSVPMRRSKDIQDELDFFHECLEAVREDINALGRKLESRLAKEERALFDVYLSMLADDALPAEVDELIVQGEWAQGALTQVILKHVRTFEMMEDAYLKERATDVKDLGRRVLAYLQAANTETIEYPERTVLIGEELTASMLGEVPPENLVGLVSVKGSSNSHVAILARSMGIPTVIGVMNLPFTQIEGSEIILDGYNGHVYFNPSEELQQRFQTIYEEELQFSKELEALKDEPCVTPDNFRLPLWVNTGLQADIARSLDRGAEGVGLFRTEVSFLLRERFPSEEEQRKIYREQLAAFAPMPVTMRTLDIGGDKSLPYFPIQEDNSFLGWRGIRVTLDHPEIFLVQVRAMMKANAGLGNLRMMLPMISSVPELEEALALIHRAYDELVEELGVELEVPSIGVMVEVPAAVYQARQLAKRVDFLSVGSNDLTQYLLAVDRNNARVADIYQAFHPAVLQALQQVVNDGHAEACKVSICGEFAGEPGAAVLLMAMGYDVLSMNAATLPKVKSVIRSISMKKAKAMLAHVMTMESAADVREYIDQSIEESTSQRLVKAMMAESIL